MATNLVGLKRKAAVPAYLSCIIPLHEVGRVAELCEAGWGRNIAHRHNPMKPFLFVLSGCLALSGCAQPLEPAVEPSQNTVFTSTREVRALGWNAKSQTLWAATAGGVLRLQSGTWAKWTRSNGLPANESFEISSEGEARFPLTKARLDAQKWQAQSAPPFQKTPLRVRWNGTTASATLDGLDLGSRVVPLPSDSNGTHISALLPLGKTLEVAIYGDGLWRFDGAKWTREDADVPAQAREITALAGDSKTLWLGTRREGIWKREAKKWSRFEQNAEMAAHNVQFMGRFRGVLWASTLDDGLIYGSGQTWNHVSTPDLSSSAPRQLFVWHDALWVRYGTGVVDCFDGAAWTKNALKTIPRPGVYALSGQETRLLASGWGGWSEWDGTSWTAHYDIPQLKGIPILGLLQDGEDVWLATQSRGAGVWNSATKKFRWLDERAGLPDDWVTTLEKSNGKLYAGTFVGGLARLDGDRWFSFPELKGENVTSICALANGKTLAATRRGLWQIEGDSANKLDFTWLDGEDQALLPDEHGVWIGARTSLNFWRSPPA